MELSDVQIRKVSAIFIRFDWVTIIRHSLEKVAVNKSIVNEGIHGLKKFYQYFQDILFLNRPKFSSAYKFKQANRNKYFLISVEKEWEKSWRYNKSTSIFERKSL